MMLNRHLFSCIILYFGVPLYQRVIYRVAIYRDVIGDNMDKSLIITEASFYILISLMKPMHGYGIMQHIEEISQGTVIMGPGTLYGSLKKLQQRGWIEQISEASSRNKKEYLITDDGKEVLEGEIRRLELMLSVGKKGIGGSDEKG